MLVRHVLRCRPCRLRCPLHRCLRLRWPSRYLRWRWRRPLPCRRSRRTFPHHHRRPHPALSHRRRRSRRHLRRHRRIHPTAPRPHCPRCRGPSRPHGHCRQPARPRRPSAEGRGRAMVVHGHRGCGRGSAWTLPPVKANKTNATKCVFLPSREPSPKTGTSPRQGARSP